MPAAMGHPEWTCEGGRFVTHEQRGARKLELDGLIAEWTRTLSTDAIAARYGRRRRTCRAHVHRGGYRVYPHYAACHMIVELPDPALSGETVRMQGVVPVLRGTSARVTRGGPGICEHNNEISGGLVGPVLLRDLRKRDCLICDRLGGLPRCVQCAR